MTKSKDRLSGLLFLTIGLFVVYQSTGYAFGDLLRMGPGFFPVMIGCALILVGASIFVTSLRTPGEIVSSFAWWPLTLMTGSIIIFAFALERFGLIASTIILVVLASVASRPFRWRSTILLCGGTVAIAVILFRYALGLPIPLGF